MSAGDNQAGWRILEFHKEAYHACAIPEPAEWLTQIEALVN